MDPRTTPPETIPATILDDLPAEQDTLDFEPYVATLADIIASPSTRTPLTIGVFGTWGAGKTSLMRMVRNRLPKGFRWTWFDAWKYEGKETLWRALLLQVLAALRAALPRDKSDEAAKARAELDDLQTALYRAVEREEVGQVTVDWDKLVKGSVLGLTHLSIGLLPGLGPALSTVLEKAQEQVTGADLNTLFDAIQRERSQIRVEQVQFLEQFQDRFNRLVAQHVVARGRRLVVFVDDLDRCLPEKAVEVLEAIKLFLDSPGCVFILGLDQAVIARGIEIKYRELGLLGEASGEDRGRFVIEGARYLEKIIQLPFQLPPIEREHVAAFVTGLVGEWPHAECPKVFAEGLGDNPRQVKRTVNVFLLLWQLARKREAQITPVRLAKVVAIQHVYPELYQVLRATPRLLRELEDFYRAETPSPRRGEGWGEGRGEGQGEGLGEGERVEPPPALAPYVGRAAVRRLLTLHPADMPDANFSGLPLDELGLYFTLTRRAEAPQVAPAEAPRAVTEPQLVRVPAGPFLMGSSDDDELAYGNEKPRHTVELPDYFIGQYPVTNAEYQAFVREAGYQPSWRWDAAEYPEGKGDHPVVNVAWEDAVAYCQWLSQKTGKPYRLPSEAEWEKAARGPDGRIYPWGNEWDKTRLNSAEGRPGDTTPVGRYSPGGDSPYGAADMAGNVWEWCHSLYKPYPYDPGGGREDEEAAGLRAIRGVSWYYAARNARAAYRFRSFPDYWDNDLGFRLALRPS
jgi:formylglycine-generating enzyme required for sulfatase activity